MYFAHTDEGGLMSWIGDAIVSAIPALLVTAVLLIIALWRFGPTKVRRGIHEAASSVLDWLSMQILVLAWYCSSYSIGLWTERRTLLS